MPAELSVDEALRARRSVRRFLDRPVPQPLVREILEAAGRAPSGTNIQPWYVHVVAGACRQLVSAAVLKAAEAGRGDPDYAYAADPLPEPYLGRRRKVGYDLYALRGIDPGDYPARRAAMLDNYRFFGAPVGLFFTLERTMEVGAWLDVGLFMQSIMLAAVARGLATCPQQSWCEYGATVRKTLGIGDDRLLVSGMALGWEQPDAPENRQRSERIDVDGFATWLGFTEQAGRAPD
ncbi:MAG TPA: nitroreductase [Allosphingosinicella sp.]|nr:nitroreductase [Allosphingosinicella sp.]